RGGMGVVYRAREPRLQTDVAIKVVLGALTPDARARFEREARACAQLRHPNLVRVVALGEEQGHPLLVMDYVAGES
ncbi:MAG TPA: serine/threonine protein kinase, partial [Planctomycetes bacterium]|nr:serine/threonine protein kinase [Planctomycetota bacterium]